MLTLTCSVGPLSFVYLPCLQENADPIDRDDQQKFLVSADFLSTHVMPDLISDMQAAATEVLKG